MPETAIITQPKTLTVTLVFETNINDNHPLYDGSDRNIPLLPGDSVVFKVEGSTDVFEVTFPDGPSPLADPTVTVGGATLAAQTSQAETVSASAAPSLAGETRRFPFQAAPKSNPPPLGGQYDTPGTVSGELEVVTDPNTPPKDRRR
jgi:hypothetical protein